MSVISAVNYFDIPTGNQNLAQTLTNGNDGAGQSIRGINDVSLNTINGSAYPPVVSTPTIASVLSAGSVASSSQTLTGLATLGATDVSLNTINGSKYPPSTPSIAAVLNAGFNASQGQQLIGLFKLATQKLSCDLINESSYPPTISQVLGAGSVASSTQTLTGLAKLGATDVSLNTINGSTYPPATPTISQVLSSGSDAGLNGITNVGALTGVSSINGTTYSTYPNLTNYSFTGGSFKMTTQQTYDIYIQVDSGNIPAGTWLFTYSLTTASTGMYIIGGTLYKKKYDGTVIELQQSGIRIPGGGTKITEYPLNFSVIFNTDGNYYLDLQLYGDTADFSQIDVNKLGGYLVKTSN
jgi:hypothetical protein